MLCERYRQFSFDISPQTRLSLPLPFLNRIFLFCFPNTRRWPRPTFPRRFNLTSPMCCESPQKAWSGPEAVGFPRSVQYSRRQLQVAHDSSHGHFTDEPRQNVSTWKKVRPADLQVQMAVAEKIGRGHFRAGSVPMPSVVRCHR